MRLLSTAAAAYVMRVKPATIRDWQRRGILTRHDGRFDIHDLVTARDTPKPRR